MDVLLLGGPLFLGRHLLDALLAGGHTVTMFNRGRTNPDAYPEVERLVGDRRDDVTALKGRRWDAAIDTSGYFPGDVRRVMDVVASSVDHYTFVSSISVYADTSVPGLDETAAVGITDDPDAEEITGENYGPLKALSEQAAEAAMPGRVANVRPGLIVGPHDPSDRFTYWVRRIGEGGEVLAPNRPEMPVQVIDGRDLAAWLVHVAERRVTGVFNATGPATPYRFDEVCAACSEAAGVEVVITPVDEGWLIEKGVAPWMGLPLWLPTGAGHDGLSAVDISRAVGEGLAFRRLVDICRDTLTWDRARDGAGMDAQLSREREAELLKEWHSR